MSNHNVQKTRNYQTQKEDTTTFATAIYANCALNDFCPNQLHCHRDYGKKNNF